MAEINLFTFPPLDTEHTARWAEVSNPHPGQRNATAPGASTRLTEMVTSLQDLPSNNSSKRHPCYPFNAGRCPKNDTQVVCKKCSDFKIWLNKSSSSNVEASWTIWTVSHRVEGLHAIFANPRATREHSKSGTPTPPGGQEARRGASLYADTTILCHLWTVLKQRYAHMSCMLSILGTFWHLAIAWVKVCQIFWCEYSKQKGLVDSSMRSG